MADPTSETLTKLEKWLKRQGRGGRWNVLISQGDLDAYEAAPKDRFPMITGSVGFIVDETQRPGTCSVLVRV